MNFGYTMYQAERTMSRAEQRAVDTRRGELAAALSGLLRRDRKATPATMASPVTTVTPAVPDCACALLAGGHEPAPQTSGRCRGPVPLSTPLAPQEHSPHPGKEAGFQPAHS